MAEAGEGAAVVGEAAAVLAEEAVDRVAGLAAAECRGHHHPLADRHRSAEAQRGRVVALDPAAVALAQVALDQEASARAAALVPAAALPAADRALGHLQGSRLALGRAPLILPAGGQAD